MKVVKVYGPLRKYLGQCRFEFVADTPAQAMKALCVNFPGLAQWLLDREAEGMAFRVTRGRDKITNEAPEGLVLPWSEREVFSIAPVIVGAGGPVGQNCAGIAIDCNFVPVPWSWIVWSERLRSIWPTSGPINALTNAVSAIGASVSLGRRIGNNLPHA
jgi:predicted phage tail protein